MLPFHLAAFVPFGVLLSTWALAAAISGFISYAQRRADRRALLKTSAKILKFPAPNPRRRQAASHQSARAAPARRAPLAG